MKKNLILFSLAAILFLQTSCVFAENLITWEEICPYNYQKVKYHKQFYTAQMTLGVLLTVSLFGIGLGIPMLALTQQTQDNNYWALRKKEYDKAVADCETAESKNMCYVQLRDDELRKNNEHSLASSKKDKYIDKNTSY